MGELYNKINEGINAANYDAVMVFGTGNFTYLSGIVLPYSRNYPDRPAAVIWTKEGRRDIICPLDWQEAVVDQEWDGGVYVLEESDFVPHPMVKECFGTALSDAGLMKARIGLDYSHLEHEMFSALSMEFPDIEWDPCDELLQNLRTNKTSSEFELLEVAARQTQRGLLGTTHHLEGTLETPGGIGYTIAEISERVRVHISEYSASHPGHMATMRGPDAALYYAPQKVTQMVNQGDLVRIDATYQFRGYWSNAGRMMVIGDPTREQESAYRKNLILKKSAEELLGPGVICGDLVRHVERVAEREGIEFWNEVGIGHGVGTSPRELPYLDRASRRELTIGMAVVLDIYTYGPRKELMHSKDTYEIAEGGARLMGKYRDWDRLHVVKGVQAVVQD